MSQRRAYKKKQYAASDACDAPYCPRCLRPFDVVAEPGTALIPLTGGHFAIIDAADAAFAFQFPWCATQKSNGVYAVRNVPNGAGQRLLYLHRALLNSPDGLLVDHINGNTLDNRRSNLRVATSAENVFNRGAMPSNKRCVKGVRHNGSNFDAVIRAHGKRLYLGSFKTEEAAALAYDTAARELHGDYARLNFPGNTSSASLTVKVRARLSEIIEGMSRLDGGPRAEALGLGGDGNRFEPVAAPFVSR